MIGRLTQSRRRMVAGLIATVVLGCGGSSYDVAPVHGKLTVGSRPLSGAKVMFAPIAKGETAAAGKAAVGLTTSDGSFTLTTYSDQDGAVVGEHWVTIFAPDGAPKGEANEVKYKRIPVPQKQVVAADQENVIDIAL
jgi:hypothetical protein